LGYSTYRSRTYIDIEFITQVTMK